jgi:hypothetical protein
MGLITKETIQSILVLGFGRRVHWRRDAHVRPVLLKTRTDKASDSPILRVLMDVHLNRFVYKEIAVKADKRITACTPIFLRSSCSGSAAQFRKVTTSFAYCEDVPGVPMITVDRVSCGVLIKENCAEPTIIVFNKAIKENPSHSNSTTREIGVVVQSLAHLHASRWIDITSEQRENIVLCAKNISIISDTGYPLLTQPPCRALMIKLRSGGKAPPLLARAASSFGHGAGK